MRDVHEIFTVFKAEYPDVYATYEALGKQVHLQTGPLPEQTRSLLKIGIAAASGHQRALETHLTAAHEAGVPKADVEHTLLLLIATCGFPAFMEAYSVYHALGLWS
jgi:4-carboxymuconolactone decarboxylase